MRILVFGDSIAHGQWDPTGGWVQHLREHYDRQTIKRRDNLTSYLDIYNLSIAGDTAELLARRMPLEIRPRKGKNPIVVVAIGVNDTMIYKGVEVNSPEMYRQELRQITESARQYTDAVLFVGMYPVDEDRCCPWRYAPEDTRFQNDRIWQFETTLREFCEETGLPMARLYERFKRKNQEKTLLADGLHPNEKGHKLIAELVKPEIDTLIT